MTKPTRNGFWNCQNRWMLRSSSLTHSGTMEIAQLQVHTQVITGKRYTQKPPGLTGSRIRFAPYDTQPLLGHPWKLLGLHPSFVQRAVSATLLPVYLSVPRNSLLIWKHSWNWLKSPGEIHSESVFYPFIISETDFLKVTQEGSPSFIWPEACSSWSPNSGISCP